MRHAANRLTAQQVKTLVKAGKPGKHRDGRGLLLSIRSSGAYWVYEYMLSRKAHDMGLGSVKIDASDTTGLVSLKEARELAHEARRLVHQGQDPIAARKADRRRLYLAHAGPTFADIAKLFLESHQGAWKSKHRRIWQSSIERYCGLINDVPVAALDTDLVVRTLSPLWKEKVETGKRLQLRLERVIDYAIAAGHRSGSNCARWKGHLDKLLPSPAKLAKPEHMPALPYAELPALMVKLADLDAPPAGALQFLILTAARTGEVIGMQWNEVDIASATWTIPPERMKAGRTHRIPLSDSAMRLLKTVERGNSFVWTFNGKKPMALDSLRKELRKSGEARATVHGMRSCFRDWCRERHVPGEVAEAALAHQIEDKTERAYARSDLLEARKDVMARWAAYLAQGQDAAVIPFAERRA